MNAAWLGFEEEGIHMDPDVPVEIRLLLPSSSLCRDTGSLQGDCRGAAVTPS